MFNRIENNVMYCNEGKMNIHNVLFVLKLTNTSTGWFIHHWVINYLTDWLTDQQADGLTNWPTDRESNRLTVHLTNRLIITQTPNSLLSDNTPTDWRDDSLSHWLTMRLFTTQTSEWLTNCLFICLSGRTTVLLVDSLTNQLIDWLLTEWLPKRFFVQGST